MKNFKAQTESGKCGLYNLANALREESFLDHENDEELVPTGIFEASKILREHEYQFIPVNVINSFGWEVEIPKDFFKTVINRFAKSLDCEEHRKSMFIFILGVQCGESKYTIHAITLYISYNSFAYSDPRDTGFNKINSLDFLYERYKYVNAVESFEYNPERNEEGTVTFKQEMVGATELLNGR